MLAISPYQITKETIPEVLRAVKELRALIGANNGEIGDGLSIEQN